MEKVTQFNKHNLKNIRYMLNLALVDVGKELGINLSIGTIRFGENEFTTKITAVTPKGAFKINTAGIAKVGPSWVPVGETIRFNGKDFVITGYTPRSQKYPILATCNGKAFKLPKHALAQ